MIHHRLSRTLTLCSVVLLFVSFGSAFADRPSQYGLSLAYPRQLLEITDQEGFPPVLCEKNFRVQITVDKKGKTKSVRADNPADSGYAVAIRKHLASIQFEPGLANGKPVECDLILHVRIIPNNFRVVLNAPVNADLSITRQTLYFQSIELNDITLPRLVSFPSYWCNLTMSDSTDIQKFILLEVSAGKTGVIENIQVVRSNYPAFESQVVAAATRAVITPALVKGKPIAAHFFLCLTFYPGNNYPTLPFTDQTFAALPLRERIQLLCLADTIGLLSGPIPKFNPAESVTGGDEVKWLNNDTVAVYLAVSATGKGGALRHDEISPKMSDWIRKTASWMRFYPALNYSGEQSAFAETVYFIFSDSTAVRIVYPWLQ